MKKIQSVTKKKGNTFSVSRDIFNHPVLEDAEAAMIWLKMISEARFSDGDLPRGCLHFSVRDVSEMYGWGIGKSKRFIENLVNCKMIIIVSKGKNQEERTVIKIVNYDKFNPKPKVKNVYTKKGERNGKRNSGKSSETTGKQGNFDLNQSVGGTANGTAPYIKNAQKNVSKETPLPPTAGVENLPSEKPPAALPCPTRPRSVRAAPEISEEERRAIGKKMALWVAERKKMENGG